MIRTRLCAFLLVALLSGCAANKSVGISKQKGQKARIGVGISKDVGRR